MDDEADKLIAKLHRLYHAAVANHINGVIFSDMFRAYKARGIESKNAAFCIHLSNAYFERTMMNLFTYIKLVKQLKEEYGIEF